MGKIIDKYKREAVERLKQEKRTLTIRNIPGEVDAAITKQAELAKKSKSDFLEELLSDTFSDVIGNYIRSEQLVSLMDKDVATLCGATLSEYWYDAAQTHMENRAWVQILGIHDNTELNRIMRAGMPWLEIRARQWKGVTHLPHGVSLLFALFAEAATRDLPVLEELHRTLFFRISEEQFLDEIDEMRKAMRLAPTERPLV